MRPGCRETLPRGLLSRREMLSSRRGRAVTVKERVGSEETTSEKEAWQVLVVRAGMLMSFLSKFVAVCTPCAFLE